MTCQKNGCREYGEESLKLAGEYPAQLCVRHHQEWADFVRATDVWREGSQILVDRNLVSLRATAGIAPERSEVEAIVLRTARNDLDLTALAKEFLAAPVEAMADAHR
jgi:hypothetical protein